jgi:predicted DNA-binding protein (UPF0251 family)
MLHTEEQKQLIGLTIGALKFADIDGETLEEIINQLGLKEQMLRQLVLNADGKILKKLLEEKRDLTLSNIEPKDLWCYLNPKVEIIIPV